MMRENKVSIIIPVFNCEKHLERTLHALLSQTLDDVEFLFVNDGSTDSSCSILQQFSEKDNRIQVINQENKGVSVARNVGISAASGEYVAFVDCDDVVKAEYIETLYEKAQNSNLDILVSTAIWQTNNKQEIKALPFPGNTIFDKDFCQSNIIKNLLSTEDLFSVWGKLYKRNFILKNNILFPIGMKYEEDSMFNIMAFQNCDSAIFIDYAGYIYMDNFGSVSRSADYNKKIDIAIKHYNFDYKESFKLNFSEEETEKLKRNRLIDKVSYILFSLSIDKSYPIKNSYNTGAGIIKKNELRKILSLDEIDLTLGFSQKIISKIIKHQSYSKLYTMMILLRLFSKLRLLNVLRKLK